MKIEQKQVSAIGKWFKRIGVAGFLFFLAKGLLWLIVPLFLGYSFCN